MLEPTGLSPCSTLARQRPSNKARSWYVVGLQATTRFFYAEHSQPPRTPERPREELPSCQDPQRRTRRSWWSGKDVAGGGVVVLCGRHHPPGQGRGRHDDDGLRPRRGQAWDLAVAGLGPFRVRGPQDQPDRLPRLRGL